MIDFTIRAYRMYLEAIKSARLQTLRFDDFLSSPEEPERYCLIRHDLDRKERNALPMARAERQMGLQATYYLRCGRRPLNRDLIRSIADLGHEIGYHYESLSRARGDEERALEDFREGLARLRAVVPVRTAAMHGSPLSRHDNRDLWRSPERRAQLREQHGLLGEVYLDIDYRDVAYVSDTGRNWLAGRGNRRDRVESDVHADFASGAELLAALRAGRFAKLVFQVHPERWASTVPDYAVQWLSDCGVNMVKSLLARA